LRQVLREAVANAVRHGGASRVAIALAEENGMLRSTVADNGTGFPADDEFPKPRSISERVAALGGSIEIASRPTGAELRFGLPLEPR
jgi:signal transduction histidine kinase